MEREDQKRKDESRQREWAHRGDSFCAVCGAPGAAAKDIPLLKLEVTSQRGQGRLAGVTTIQRLNTRCGVADGLCESVGAFLSVPYAADYAFYKKLD